MYVAAAAPTAQGGGSILLIVLVIIAVLMVKWKKMSFLHLAMGVVIGVLIAGLALGQLIHEQAGNAGAQLTQLGK